MNQKFLKRHKFKFRSNFHQKVQRTANTVFILVSTSSRTISVAQIETARRSISRIIKKIKRRDLLVRVFPRHPKTAIPAETRMGGGKGSVSEWVAPIRPGTILFEITGVTERIAREALKKATFKLTIKLRVLIS